MADFGTSRKKSLSDISAIGFNWSGTISNDLRLAYMANKWMSINLGLAMDDDLETWANLPVCSPAEYYATKLQETKRSGNATAYERLANLTEKGYAVLFRQMSERVGHALRDAQPKPFPGAVKAIHSLARATKLLSTSNRMVPRIFVVAACQEDRLFVDATGYGLNRHTEFWKVVGDVVNTPAVIREIVFNEMALTMDQVAYVGGTRADVKMAKACGMTSVAVLSGYNKECDLRNEQPDFVFKDVAEFARAFLYA